MSQTQLIILGQGKAKNPIVFKKVLSVDHFVDPILQPRSFKYIELVKKESLPTMDIMFAYNDENKRHEGFLYLGYWNDGVV